jgi:hypothetical protein
MDEITWTEVAPGDWNSQDFDYGVRDAKGRAVGGFVRLERLFPRVNRRTESGDWVTERTGPDFYYVTHNTTRDGRGFGAIPNGTRCSTLEEAKTLASKKVNEARRRFQRAAAKGEGRQFAKKEAV